MKTLAELEKAMKEVERMKSDFARRLGGGEWVVCFYDTYAVPRFGAWRVEDNNKIINDISATLSTDAIIECGAYTEKELKPLLERIMELANE